ncbi:COX15/CtaA family protein [Alteromonas sp. D210916BOD_24]|uniref:COX15/CtaA family protein n=1 Tax=Alteromonas sp. D210916BOD_24 TaxID=3157618 RepID=UPI00399CD321
MRKLTLFSIFLAAVVIILGAYTRLTDAGLGCPDWPGCYGHVTVPLSEEKVAAANAAYPERPVEAAKAWNEMIHRYFAGTLGLCVLAIAVLAVKGRHNGTPVRLPVVLLCLIIFQAALGMWTVTLNLLPVVVMGHLLGGFSVLACLFILYLRLRDHQPDAVTFKHSNSVPLDDVEKISHTQHKLRRFALVGVAIVVVQIALGGWTSANYAALACTELPICESGWQERLDVVGAYSVPEAENYEFGAHDYGERVTMHILHRAGALVTFVYIVALGISVLFSQRTSAPIKRIAQFVLGSLILQVALGISNVVFMLPLGVAVLHNAVAAILLLSLLALVYYLTPLSNRRSVSIFGGQRHAKVGNSPIVMAANASSASYSSHSITKASGGFHG